MYLKLTRLTDNGVQTTGFMQLFDNTGNVLLSFQTLELSWKDNRRQVSCIPDENYVVQSNFSFRFGRTFRLVKVLGRDNILIHAGNFNRDTKGCILIGLGFCDIDGDDFLDVMNSRLAMKNLLSTLVTPTTIAITSKWNDYELK